MIITLTGPTCSGKTTLEAALQKAGCGRAVSHTTRWPRSGEVDGEAYHFVTDAEYKRLEFSGAFIETIEFGSARYAMSSQALLDAQKDAQNVVIVVEPHGAAQIHQFCLANGLPSFAVWVDCAPKTQAQRWIQRLMSDMVIGKEVVGAYASRLETMLTDEAIWRSEVKHGSARISPMSDKLYDLFLDSDEQSATELARVVLDALKALA